MIATTTAARSAALFLLPALAAVAQPPAVKAPDPLPPKIAALVPGGMRVIYQRFTGAPTLAVAEFSVEKSLPEGRSTYYTFALNAYDATGPIWKMREPIYRQQVDQKIATERQSAPPALSTAEPPKETKYGWGSGLTRRVAHNPPQAKAYVDYQCVYFGMIGGVTVDLRVAGLPDSCGAADQWAAGVASAAAKISVSNIADK